MKRFCKSVFFLLLTVANVTELFPENYFQQEVNYVINVSLDDQNHKLNSYIEIEYINNSNDTLHKIYMHLWPNAFKNNNTAFAKQKLLLGKTDFHFAPDSKRGYIDSLNFKVNNNPIDWKFYTNHKDIALLFPGFPVMPGDTIVISSPFRVKFPDSSFSRLGHNGQAYHATQWFPKPAVYDRNGWHPMPYLHFGEYYSELGTFDVYITLANNYIVAASGELKTKSEIEFIDSLATHWSNIMRGHSLPDRMPFPESSKKEKTLHFHLSNAHDFAWIADKRFYVLKGSVKPQGHNSQVNTYAYFVSGFNIWQNAITYINRSLEFMADKVGPFPYETFSAVQIHNSGGANMEYPGLTAIGDKMNNFYLDRVIAHEAIHNWFYGALAFNERAYPWLDEGFTSYYDNRYVEKYYPNRRLVSALGLEDTGFAKFFDLNHYPYKKSQHLIVSMLSRLNIDLPPSLHTEEFDMANYFAMVYYKAAISIKHLEKYLGTDEFDRIMQEFYNKWQFKHPYPEDVREFFEKETNKDLSWFFDGLISSTKKLDYSIVNYKLSNDKYIITLKNNGQIAAPIPVSAINNDEIVKTIWVEGFEDTKEVSFPKKEYTKFSIDPEYYTLDYKRRNNTIHINKTFPRMQPLKLQPYFSLENPLKTQIFASPLIGWNKNDGIMPGIAFYNQTVPFNSFEYFLMPMYSFNNKKPSGRAWAYKTFFSKSRNIIHSFRAGFDFKSFGTPSFYDENEYYLRLQPSAKITFNKSIAPGQLENKLKLRYIYLDKPVISLNIFPEYFHKKRYKSSFIELSYIQSRNMALSEYSFYSGVLSGDGLIKASAEFIYSFIFERNSKAEFRLFGGKIFKNSHSSIFDYRLRLSSQTSNNDYLIDNFYLGRGYKAGTFYGNQIFESGGGFRMITAVGQTNDWLVTFNATIDIPVLPVKLFADIGTYHNAKHAYPGSLPLPYVAGLQLEPISNFLRINFPLAVSKDIERASRFMYNNYWEKITFSLRLDKLNPFENLRSITKYFY